MRGAEHRPAAPASCGTAARRRSGSHAVRRPRRAARGSRAFFLLMIVRHIRRRDDDARRARCGDLVECRGSGAADDHIGRRHKLRHVIDIFLHRDRAGAFPARPPAPSHSPASSCQPNEPVAWICRQQFLLAFELHELRRSCLFISRAPRLPQAETIIGVLSSRPSARRASLAPGEEELLPHGHADRPSTRVAVAVGRFRHVLKAHQECWSTLSATSLVARPGTALDSCTAVGMPRRAVPLLEHRIAGVAAGAEDDVRLELVG